MDIPGLDVNEVEAAYASLRRVNWMLGNNRSLLRELDRFLVEDAGDPNDDSRLTLLDVGSGSGDVPLRLAARVAERQPHRGVLAIALDREETALAMARRDRRGIAPLRGDALRLPFLNGSISFVTAVKFAHHFEGAHLSSLLAELARVARRRVVVLDIRRHWFAYWGFVLWSLVFTRSRLVRHDGPLSVLRGFTDEELLEATRPLTAFHWEVRRYPGFQLALIGARLERGGS